MKEEGRRGGEKGGGRREKGEGRGKYLVISLEGVVAIDQDLHVILFGDGVKSFASGS
jgi:hypothetical protein